MPNKTYPVLSSDLQVAFHYRLKTIKNSYFYEALGKTVKELNIKDVDLELNSYVSTKSMQKLASFSLRGEVLFPIPIILNANPFLLGYYRLLLGFSQKEFYSKGPFGAFKLMEEKGKLSPGAAKDINELCKSLISSSESFLDQIDELNLATLTDLQILTVGPQLRGSKNNEYGQVAIQKTFIILKDLVGTYITNYTPSSIELNNDSGRKVIIKFTSDPDIAITEQLPSGDRPLISIEVKGGKDISNVHNRIGEAEKSHQKAKLRGYFEFMTIISVDMSYKTLKSESPTSNHFFHLEKISDKLDDEFLKFKELISSIIGINI